MLDTGVSSILDELGRAAQTLRIVYGKKRPLSLNEEDYTWDMRNDFWVESDKAFVKRLKKLLQERSQTNDKKR